MVKQYEEKAAKKVSKAVSVFDKAILEVQAAQAMLEKGVEADSFNITAINTQMVKLQGEVADLNAAIESKKQKMLSNIALLDKLIEFRA